MRWMNKKKKSTTTATRKSYNQLQPVRLPSNQIHQLTVVPPTQISLQFWSPAQLDSIQRHFFCFWNLTICRASWTKFVNFSSNSWIFSFIPFVGQRNDSMKGNYSPRVSSAPARSIHPSIHSEEATPWPPSEWMGQINGARPFFRIISTLSRKKKS